MCEKLGVTSEFRKEVAQIEYIFLSNVSASQQGQDWSALGVPTQLDNSESLFVKH